MFILSQGSAEDLPISILLAPIHCNAAKGGVRQAVTQRVQSVTLAAPPLIHHSGMTTGFIDKTPINRAPDGSGPRFALRSTHAT
ncbi:hypothetical protein AO263_34980 [Pseudomonas sp. NZIPFR-PS5]|nr:hypothetical protein AO263_34980 [Pseudomonas sp. NZIPFR-PS5]